MLFKNTFDGKVRQAREAENRERSKGHPNEKIHKSRDDSKNASRNRLRFFSKEDVSINWLFDLLKKPQTSLKQEEENGKRETTPL